MIWSTESGISFGGFWYDFGKICLYQSVFVLGNLLLKKHKVALTLLAMLFLHGFCIGVLPLDKTGRSTSGDTVLLRTAGTDMDTVIPVCQTAAIQICDCPEILVNVLHIGLFKA